CARLRRADLGIELEDPPLPIQQVELGNHAATAGSVERRSGTSLRNQARTNETPQMTAPTRNTGWSAVENASTYSVCTCGDSASTAAGVADVGPCTPGGSALARSFFRWLAKIAPKAAMPTDPPICRNMI